MKRSHVIVLGCVGVGIAAAFLVPIRSDPLARLKSIHRRVGFTTSLATMAGFVGWARGEKAGSQRVLDLEDAEDVEATMQVAAGNVVKFTFPVKSLQALEEFARTNFKGSLYAVHGEGTNMGILFFAAPTHQSNAWVRRFPELRSAH